MPDVAREIPIDPRGLSREKVADWVFPYFVRADILALYYQSLLPAGSASVSSRWPQGPWRSSPCR